MRLVVIDLGEGIKAVFREHYLVPALLQEYLGAAPDGIAVVNDQDFES
jgi:hypothetical protein